MKKAFFILLIVPICKAYIPSFPFILKQAVNMHGQGMYQINQELLFKQGITDLILKETWWINKFNMRVDVTLKDKTSAFEAKKFYLRFIYNTYYKIFNNTKNKRIKKNISLYHIEKPFYIRQTSALNRLFYLWNMAPPPLSPSSTTISLKENVDAVPTVPVPPDFITLSRKQGVVLYRIVKSASIKKPALWIEQDAFVIRSWEWKTPQNKINGKMKAWDYKSYPGSLFLPTQRVFSWLSQNSTKEVIITVTNVQKIKQNKNLFKTNTLNQTNHIPANLSKTHKDTIYEFYKKFR